MSELNNSSLNVINELYDLVIGDYNVTMLIIAVNRNFSVKSWTYI